MSSIKAILHLKKSHQCIYAALGGDELRPYHTVTRMTGVNLNSGPTETLLEDPWIQLLTFYTNICSWSALACWNAEPKLCLAKLGCNWYDPLVLTLKSASATHICDLPLDKIAAISQTIFSDAFSWMKSFMSSLKSHWSLFLRVQLTISHHWFR